MDILARRSVSGVPWQVSRVFDYETSTLLDCISVFGTFGYTF